MLPLELCSVQGLSPAPRTPQDSFRQLKPVFHFVMPVWSQGLRDEQPLGSVSKAHRKAFGGCTGKEKRVFFL